MLSEQWKAIPMPRRVVYFALAGACAVGLLQWVFYVLLGMTGWFDVAASWWGKPVVIEDFPFARILLALILAAVVSLSTLATVLWRQTRSLAGTVLVPVLALAAYLAVWESRDGDLAFSIEQTAKWC